MTKPFHNVHPRGKRKPGRSGPTSLDRVKIRPAPTNKDGFQIVSTTDDYRCPFCPDHIDELFFSWIGVLEQPICYGCTYELFNIVIHGQDLWSSASDRIAELERLAGKSLKDLRITVLQNEITQLRNADNLRLHLAGYVREYQDYPRSCMSRAMRLRLDRESESRAMAEVLWRSSYRRQFTRQRRADALARTRTPFVLRKACIARWQDRLARFEALLCEALATEKDAQ